MPDYLYRAIDKDGKTTQGTLTAENNKHLAYLLQQNGLFLVHSSLAHPITPEEPTAPLPQDQEQQPLLPEIVSTNPDSNTLTWKQCILVFAIVMSGVLVGLFQVYSLRHPKNTAVLLNEKLVKLSPGMSREEVERNFSTSLADSPDPAKGRYFVPPHFIVEMVYETSKNSRTKSQQTLRSISQITIAKDSRKLVEKVNPY